MGEETKHSTIDPEALNQRMASRQMEQRHELDFEVKPQLMIMSAQCARIPIIEDKLNIALTPRPVHPLVQAAVAVGMLVGAVALVGIFFEMVRSQPAAASVTVTETARR